MFDPDDENRGIDINDQFPDKGEWKLSTNEPEGPEGDVYVRRIDEPFLFATQKRGDMDYTAGDYIAITGDGDQGFCVWPVTAAELANSDGRMVAATRYQNL